MNIHARAEPLGSDYKYAKRDRRRGEILDAAATVFARKGYYAATMQDIAGVLGMRPASLYYYFKSKEAALEEVCRLGGREFVRNLKELAKSERPILETIQAGIQLHLDSRWRDYVANFAFNRQNLPEGVRGEMNTIARRYAGLWKQILERGSKAGVLIPDLDAGFAARALIAICNSTASADAYQTGVPASTAEKVMNTVLDGIRRRNS